MKKNNEILTSKIINYIFNKIKTTIYPTENFLLLFQIEKQLYISLIFEANKSTEEIEIFTHLLFPIKIKKFIYEKSISEEIYYIDKIILKEKEKPFQLNHYKETITNNEITFTNKCFYEIKNNYILINQELFVDKIEKKTEIFEDFNISLKNEIEFDIQKILDNIETNTLKNIKESENIIDFINIDKIEEKIEKENLNIEEGLDYTKLILKTNKTFEEFDIKEDKDNIELIFKQ